jgi:hypothetical protein
MRDATSSNIADYNTFVQAAANAAGLGGVTWKVIGSTGTVDARDNTSSNPSVNGAGEAVFLVDGSTVVANNYADLWDSSIDAMINMDEYGTRGIAASVATGSNPNGTKRDRHLGGSDEVPSKIEYGNSAQTNNYWALVFNGLASESYRYYALSEPIPYVADPETQIAMIASTASDASGVEYYFTETSGNPGGSYSGWQDSPVYTDTGLTPGLTYSYRVTARDKSAAHNATLSSVAKSATTAVAVNLPPVITSVPVTQATVGEFYSYTMSATDPERQPVTFRYYSRPAWSAFNQTTGTLSGIPTEARSYSVILLAGDGVNTSTQQFTLVVSNPLAGYDLWALDNGVGSATADDDGDGFDNLYEYALGGDPNNSADNGVEPSLVKSGSGLEYKHLKHKTDTNLIYAVQVCTDLLDDSWQDVNVATGTNSYSAEYDEVVHEISTIPAKSFIRLEIQNP